MSAVPDNDQKEDTRELSDSQVQRLADFQSVPQGQGWNLYFGNEGNQPFGIYVYQKPNDDWTQGSVGTAWRVVNVGAKTREYGPFPLPVGFSATMFDQLDAYNDPQTKLELVNYDPLPHPKRPISVNSSQPLPMGTRITYDQNFAEQGNGQYVPSFSITSATGPEGKITVDHASTYVEGTGMKNQNTMLQINKLGLPLFQSDSVRRVGMLPNATYTGGLPPGFSGFLSVESKIYVGLSANRFVQGQTYSYQQLSQDVSEYSLPASGPNDILVTLSGDTPPRITFRQFTATSANDASAFGEILRENLNVAVIPTRIAWWVFAGGHVALGGVALHGTYAAINNGYRFQNLTIAVPGFGSVAHGQFNLPHGARDYEVKFQTPLIRATLYFTAPPIDEFQAENASVRREELKLQMHESVENGNDSKLTEYLAESRALNEALGGGRQPTVSGKITISTDKGPVTESLEEMELSQEA